MSKRSGSGNRDAGREPIQPTPDHEADTPIFDEEKDDLFADDPASAQSTHFPSGPIDFVDADPPSPDTTQLTSGALTPYGAEMETIEIEMFTPIIDRNQFRPPPHPISLAEVQGWEESEALHQIDEMDGPYLEAREHRDPAPVWVENGHWAGSEQMYPPFTVAEFEQAYPAAVPITHGFNPPKVMAISETDTIRWEDADRWYITRLDHADYIDPTTNTVRQHPLFGEIENPARYRSSADVATYHMALVLGLQDHVPETHAFFYEGHYYIASKYIPDCEVLTGALRINPENGYISNPRDIPSENLPAMALFEYLIQDADLAPDTYSVHINEQDRPDRLIKRTRGGALQFNGTWDLQGSWAARLYEAKHGVNGAVLPRPLIQSFVNHEREVLAIVHSHRLDAGMGGLIGRFQRLQTLLQIPGETTVGDLGLEPLDLAQW